jgi:hypothetical protein
VYDCHLAVFEQPLEASHAAVQAKVIIQNPQFALWQADFWSMLVIGIIAVGNHGVESIVATREFKDYQYLAVRSCGGGCMCGLAKQGWRQDGAAESSNARPAIPLRNSSRR